MEKPIERDVLIIGAGAAGLMCAIEAGRRGRRVTLLEHNREIGRKILISGGGRSNFTNLNTRPENFISRNPHFAKSSLARYTPADFVRLVEKHGIPYHEKSKGQLFCDRSARDITEMLVAECRAAAVDIALGCEIREVRSGQHFTVETSSWTYRSSALVIASGGLSVPKTGATAFGYRVAGQFGLKMVETRPALVPLALSSDDQRRWCDLAGVSTEVVAGAGGAKFREKLLITHRGLSGPAVLQASSYWMAGEALTIDLAPEIDLAAELRAHSHRQPRSILSAYLPKRLADRWCEIHATVTDPADLDRRLHSWTVRPSGTEGFAKAEVTAGGIDTSELSSKTMESRKVPGLYFIGEVVDVTGQLGGFNFQWAWASGWSAGQVV